MKAIRFLIVVALLGFVPSAGYGMWVSFGDATTPTRPQITLSGSEIIELETYGLISHDMEAEGDTYQLLRFSGGGHIAEIGRPELPTVAILMEIEPGVEPTVTIIDSTSQILDGYLVYPAQEPRIEWDDTTEFVRDDSLYSEDGFYPKNIVALSFPRVLRGHRLVLVILYPVQHNPVTGQLRVYPELRVSVSGAGSVASPKDSPHFRSMLNRLALNYEPVGGGKGKGGDGADYLIMVHDDLYDEILPLAEWRQRTGLKTRVVKLSELGGDPTADQIADYVQVAYDTWDPAPSFLLLVGDADLLPVHYKYPHPFGDEKVGTDLYYATVDTENDPPDTQLVDFPDILVGRLPVDESDIGIVVDKILGYERDPYTTSSEWFNRVLLAGHFEDFKPDGREDRFFIYTSEVVQDFLEGEGYDRQRVYTCSIGSTPQYYHNGDPIPGHLTFDGTTQDVIDAINQGCFLVNHRDHGDSYNAPSGGYNGWNKPWFVTEDIPSLGNGDKLPVMFSINCRTGWFDGETDLDSPDYLITDCLGEALLKAQGKGVVGFIGSTRISYSGYNDELCKGFYDAIWDDFDPGYCGTQIGSPTDRLGAILNYGKFWMFDKYVLTGGAGYPSKWAPTPEVTRVEFEDFHVLGDPALRIWTGVPQPLAVSHPCFYQIGPSSITINAGVPDALVCLWKESEDYHEIQYTDANGEATFNTSFSTYDELKVTVTKHNNIPYETELACGVHGHITENTTWSGDIYVYGDVTVDDGALLTIDPGVTVYFSANSDVQNIGLYPDKCELLVDGALRAIGVDDYEITFCSSNTSAPSISDWGGISTHIGDGGNLTLNFCAIKDAYQGVWFNSFATISNSEISHCQYAVVANGWGEISHNKITVENEGLACSPTSNYLTISNNSILGNGDDTYGILCWGSSSHLCKIRSNTITDMSHFGIGCMFSASPDIERNLLTNNNIAVQCTLQCCPNIINNTIPGNNTGIRCIDNCYLTITNTIITSNSDYGIYSDVDLFPNISYNDLWGNGVNYQGCAVGREDISADPMFLNSANGDYHLQAGSPCIDTGYPLSPKDPDGTRADMGAFYHHHSPYNGCPYVFTWDGEKSVEDNNLLPLAELLENEGKDISDYYQLQQPLVPEDGNYYLELREFENEHSWIDQLQLMAVEHPSEVKVAVSTSGKILGYKKLTGPISAVDSLGGEFSKYVSAADGLVFRGRGGDELTVNFGQVKGIRKVALVIGGTVAKDQSKRRPKAEPMLIIGDDFPKSQTVLGISYRENKYTELVELPWRVSEGREVEVRLLWQIPYDLDFIGLVGAEDVSLKIRSCPLAKALHSANGSVLKSLLQPDGVYAELIPGQEVRLAFSAPKQLSDYERDFVLVTTGHYVREDKKSVPSCNESPVPSVFTLSQNYPNPFNLITEINYGLAGNTYVTLKIYNIKGQLVKTLVDEDKSSGYYKTYWDGKDRSGKEVTSGIYFCRFQAGDFSLTRKMVLLK